MINDTSCYCFKQETQSHTWDDILFAAHFKADPRCLLPLVLKTPFGKVRLVCNLALRYIFKGCGMIENAVHILNFPPPTAM